MTTAALIDNLQAQLTTARAELKRARAELQRHGLPDPPPPAPAGTPEAPRTRELVIAELEQLEQVSKALRGRYDALNDELAGFQREYEKQQDEIRSRAADADRRAWQEQEAKRWAEQRGHNRPDPDFTRIDPKLDPRLDPKLPLDPHQGPGEGKPPQG